MGRRAAGCIFAAASDGLRPKPIFRYNGAGPT